MGREVLCRTGGAIPGGGLLDPVAKLNDAHVLLAGDGANQFAAEAGVEMADDQYFFTQHRWDQLQEAIAAGRVQLDHAAGSAAEPKSLGTVGAVACDADGRLAAAVPAETKQLQALVADAAAARAVGRSAGGGVMRISRRSNAAPLSVLVTALAIGRDCLVAEPPVASVFVFDTADPMSSFRSFLWARDGAEHPGVPAKWWLSRLGESGGLGKHSGTRVVLRVDDASLEEAGSHPPLDRIPGRHPDDHGAGRRHGQDRL